MGKFDGIIIVSDIDGTFLGRNGRLVPENLRAIEYFQKEGGSFTVATGREHFLVPPSIPDLDRICNIPMIACGFVALVLALTFSMIFAGFAERKA